MKRCAQVSVVCAMALVAAGPVAMPRSSANSRLPCLPYKKQLILENYSSEPLRLSKVTVKDKK